MAVVALSLAIAAPSGAVWPETVDAATLTISKATYYDKTLAGILGQVGGFLTGFEYASPNPYPTDDCFLLTRGPYSGDSSTQCWTPNGYPGYDRHEGPNFSAGQIGGDDDYHIDFFIQHILATHGPTPSFQDIKDEWVEHDIGDFGAGFEANRLMRDEGLIPPLTGQAEHNKFYWLTEAYIETETVGMVAPGMPATARDLVERFASVVGEFDSVLWAKYLATMYSLAYFESDARVVADKAADVLPRGSWPYLIYQKVKRLHAQNSTDWRWAQSELLSFTRNVYRQDNPQAIPDRNNGSLLIAIFYGNNDYTTTAKIASLIGNDADCTASAALGLMGILKGMAGTPQAIKDRVYFNGAGRYINDLATGFDTFIRNNYPASQSWDDLTALYRSNAEAQITAGGGSSDATNYYINGQSISPPVEVAINNYDFEQGNLSGWTKWTPTTDGTPPHAFAENNGTAQSGAWKGTVFTDATISEVKLYATLRGLESGATYRANAFVQTNQNARLYVENYGGGYLDSAVISTYGITDREWVNRSIEFTVSGSTAQVGLRLPPGAAGWAAIDNLTVMRITNPAKSRYEAESATRSGGEVRSSVTASSGQYVGGLDFVGNYVEFTVNAPTAGEYRAAVNYANGWTSVGKLGLHVNGSQKATIPFPRTGSWAAFSRNIVNVPVELQAGNNTIRLRRDADAGYVELDYLELSTYPATVSAGVSSNVVANPGFEADGATQTPTSWGTWPGSSGAHADADYTETGGEGGTYRGTHYKASAYEVFTDQTVTGLTNGTYTLRAWVVGGGDQTSAYMSAKGYGTGVPELTADIPALGWRNWRQIVVGGIAVTNGQITIGFYSNAGAGNWYSFDDVELVRQ